MNRESDYMSSDGSLIDMEVQSDYGAKTTTQGKKQPISTYDQLRESILRKFCGQSLVQIVAKFQKVSATSRSILRQVQRARKSSELMDDLSKADLNTIKTFIQNNITADRLLSDILQQPLPADQDVSGAERSPNQTVPYQAGVPQRDGDATSGSHPARRTDGDGATNSGFTNNVASKRGQTNDNGSQTGGGSAATCVHQAKHTDQPPTSNKQDAHGQKPQMKEVANTMLSQLR